ncbi:hypothetical protein [Actinophytocola sp.]|uniref:hypothetical protein n=1 Tax=Actinophytocola sp. TaxID=1872138 RepID=UPI003899CEF9
MIVAIPVGAFVKLVLALTVALVVILMLLIGSTTDTTPSRHSVPSTVDIRADR